MELSCHLHSPRPHHPMDLIHIRLQCRSNQHPSPARDGTSTAKCEQFVHPPIVVDWPAHRVEETETSDVNSNQDVRKQKTRRRRTMMKTNLMKMK